MEIKELFQKDIYKNINGVIRVEQNDYGNAYQELDEYVVTKEINKHFHDFFTSYIKSLEYKTDKIGVWVSGSFGSGKSYFIKILSYLLSNKKVNGKTSLEFFENKFHDEMLLSDIKRAITKGTTDVILFNIYSKGDVLKESKESLVEVFMKVFNDMQGYYYEKPWLAELERELDKREQYSEFKDKYKEITGQDWVENRGAFRFDRDNIVKALTESTDMSEEFAANWYDTREEVYAINTNKFGKILLNYCNAREDHRIIFLVDEMGQYIDDNIELMLELKKITEDLGRMLQGKAWIVVTSKEDIDSISNLKDRWEAQIKSLFATQLNLSFDNPDEFIKKCILKKKKTSKDFLSLYYNEKQRILDNLIIFSSNTAEMKSYASSEEFSEVYPFIPYQFNLVQKVFEQIRRIGTLSPHLSDVTRSILNAFQEVIKMIKDKETGNLVSFSIFYKYIETFLPLEINKSINQPRENSYLKPEDIELLKILFMIKYIKRIRPNLENLATLSISHIDEDKIILRNSINLSLERLTTEKLVSKNEDEYEFLTDEEQSVEREIKRIETEKQNSKKKRDKILIVYDEPSIVRSLKITLIEDYDVITTYKATKVLELVKTESPDLIFLDLDIVIFDVKAVTKSFNSSIAIINGLELCKMLSKNEITKGIPIITISQNIHDTDLVKGLNSGAVDYIKKPFSLGEVMARIRATLRIKESYSKALNEKYSLTFREMVLLKYPAPLALTYKRMDDEREVCAKHSLLGDLFEVMVKYCASILIGQYLKDKNDDKKINNELQKLERPSIGSWASFFNEILEFYHKNNQKLIIPELYDFYYKKNKSAVLKECCDILTSVLNRQKIGGILTIKQFFNDILANYRNKTRGHGATICKEEYKRRVDYLQPALEAILSEMKFISRFKLGYVEDIRYTRGLFEHTIVLFTGNDTPHRRYVSKDDNKLEDYYMYLFSEEEGELKPEVNLNPFIIYKCCEKCMKDGIFFLNEGKEKEIEYLSYQCGDTLPTKSINGTDTYLDDFKMIMSQIKAL